MTKEYIMICPQCGDVRISHKNEGVNCSHCSDSASVFSGYEKWEWYNLPLPKRNNIVKEIKRSLVTSKISGIISVGDSSSGAMYSLDGALGCHIDVYENRCEIIAINNITRPVNNLYDGVKTMWFVDCIGLHFRPSTFDYGYLQIETASPIVKNVQKERFNENTFVFDDSTPADEVRKIYLFMKSRIDRIKRDNEISHQLSIAEALMKYKQLLDNGAITVEEYEKKKKQMMVTE